MRHPIDTPCTVSLRRAAAVLCATLLFGALTPTNAAALPQQKCSDFTPDNRPCTATEQFGYCLTQAAASYDDCSDGAGFIKSVGCAIALEVDVVACVAGLPLSTIGTVLKSE